MKVILRLVLLLALGQANLLAQVARAQDSLSTLPGMARIDSLREHWLSPDMLGKFESVDQAISSGEEGSRVLSRDALLYLNIALDLGFNPGPYIRCGTNLGGVVSANRTFAIVSGPPLERERPRQVLVNASGSTYTIPGPWAVAVSDGGVVATINYDAFDGSPELIEVRFFSKDGALLGESEPLPYSRGACPLLRYPDTQGFIGADFLFTQAVSESVTGVWDLSVQGDIKWYQEFPDFTQTAEAHYSQDALSVPGALGAPCFYDDRTRDAVLRVSRLGASLESD